MYDYTTTTATTTTIPQSVTLARHLAADHIVSYTRTQRHIIYMFTQLFPFDDETPLSASHRSFYIFLFFT